jgi:hypothetical protein
MDWAITIEWFAERRRGRTRVQLATNMAAWPDNGCEDIWT